MAKTGWLVAAFVAVALLAGVIGAFGFSSNTVQTVTKEVQVAGPTVYQNVSVPVPTDKDYRAQAVQTVADRLSNSDNYLTCNGLTYNSDQVSVSRLYNDYNVSFLGDADHTYTVEYTAKYAFDDGSRNRNVCYDLRTYSVTYQDAEKPVVVLH